MNKGKYILITLSSVLGIIIGLWAFNTFYYIEASAKKNYQEAKIGILENWNEHEKEIRLVFNVSKTFSHQGSIELKDGNLLKIHLYGSKKYPNRFMSFLGSKNKKLNISNEDIDEAAFINLEEADCEFSGTLKDKDLIPIIKFLSLSKKDFLHFLSLIRASNCHTISWGNKKPYLIYTGNHFIGSFSYYYGSVDKNQTKNNFEEEQLNNNIYWSFYESGLLCAPAPFIPN